MVSAEASLIRDNLTNQSTTPKSSCDLNRNPNEKRFYPITNLRLVGGDVNLSPDASFSYLFEDVFVEPNMTFICEKFGF